MPRLIYQPILSTYSVTIPLKGGDVDVFLLGRPTKKILLKLLSNKYLCNHLTQAQKDEAIEIIAGIEGPIEPIEGLHPKAGWQWLSNICFGKFIKVHFLRSGNVTKARQANEKDD